MDKTYMQGELLRISTKNSEVFVGRFFNMTKDRSKITLCNAKDYSLGYVIESVCHFYNTEVTDIVKLVETEEQTHLKISPRTVKEILKVANKFKFINQVDAQFHEALKYLNTGNYVAVSNDGASMGRKCQMPFLVMSTLYQIYIFDIQIMQYHAFDAGLRELLEAESPKKIIHDCRKLSDCLSHKHNVKLASVFDSQVADIIIRKNKTGHYPKSVKSLSECINIYLGVNFDIIELDIVECNKRPINLELKETLARNIAYLYHLSDVINEELLLPFNRGVEFYIDKIRSSDDFKAWELYGKHKQLPKEFKNAIEN